MCSRPHRRRSSCLAAIAHSDGTRASVLGRAARQSRQERHPRQLRLRPQRRHRSADRPRSCARPARSGRTTAIKGAVFDRFVEVPAGLSLVPSGGSAIDRGTRERTPVFKSPRWRQHRSARLVARVHGDRRRCSCEARQSLSSSPRPSRRVRDSAEVTRRFDIVAGNQVSVAVQRDRHARDPTCA